MAAAESTSRPRSEAHVTWAWFAITGVSLAVCLCMAALGVMKIANYQVAGLVSQAKVEGGFRDLPSTWEWAVAGIGAFAVASVLLHTPGTWRRVIFWIASLAITFFWAPALALAGYQPNVSVPCLAIFVAGAGSLFYTSRHRMPCDESH